MREAIKAVVMVLGATALLWRMPAPSGARSLLASSRQLEGGRS